MSTSAPSSDFHEITRFGGLIEIGRGPRGEERFHAAEEPNRFTELVKDSLSFFTPWYTTCLVPAGVNPIMDGIEGLSSHGPQGEDKIEVDRIHAVLHPDCHGRLIKSLGFEEPERTTAAGAAQAGETDARSRVCLITNWTRSKAILMTSLRVASEPSPDCCAW